jgi:acyl carrier protein
MTADRNRVEADLLQFVRSRGPRHAEVTADTDLLDSGLLDSLLLTDLILQIEGQHDIQLYGPDVTPANFRTVSAIVNLVLEQLPQQPA